MNKWADYLISAVRHNVTGTHIVKVQVHIDNGDTVGAPFEMTREEVVAHIDVNKTFATIYKNVQGNWQFGSYVKTVTINGVRYIKTRADSTMVDNLDDLPRF